MLKQSCRGASIRTLCFAFALSSGLPAQASPSALLVWHFDRGITNLWGGEYNAYSRRPSSARTYLDARVHKPGAAHSLRITVHREAAGFCGVWLDFHPASHMPRRYLDASPFRFLGFWIKGRVAGGSIDARLEDEAAQQNPDQDSGSTVKIPVPGEAQNEWQEIMIPLENFHGLDLRRLARLTLNFTRPGDSRFYIDDVAFKAAKSAVLPSLKTSALVRGGGRRAPINAMWVWNAKELLSEDGGSDRFFTFCAKTGVNRIFLALELETFPAPSGSRFELKQPDDYRKFLERAHQEGLQVEGLAGTPEWAVEENHPAAVAAVNAVLSFNRSSPRGERFDGIHFDVEPYILAGYADAEDASDLLQSFLRMISLCARQVHTQPGLQFTCDVPAYFYPAAGPDSQPFVVEFNGRRKTVGEHLTDLLDSVTLMDYRNEADGAGGAIAAALPALRYAASRGKTILVGLETSSEPESTIYFTCGIPREEFRERLKASDLGSQLTADGYRLVSFSDGINIHVGLVAPSSLAGDALAPFDQALIRLTKQFGAASGPSRFTAGSIIEEARAALAHDPEWEGFETFELTDPETGRSVEGFRTMHRMAPRTTFHGLGYKVFEEETRSLREWLRFYPSFGGLAIHHYESYRELLEGQ